MESQRYYCHQCSVEFPTVSQDFTCPTCNSGFIEELGAGNPGADGGGNDDPMGPPQMGANEALGPLMEALLPSLIGGGPPGAGRGRAGRTRIQISRNPPVQTLGMDQAALETAIQDFVVNLAGMGFAGGGGGGMGPMQAMQMGGHPGGVQIHMAGPGLQIHGNPRDYAWGRGGLDTIITMLLNQVDGAGPPPMDNHNIQEIPTVKISEAQVADNSSCSVCWEDFSVDEEVKQLECDHFFHGPCIVPWLELHGTCPVCRKVLNPAAAARAAAPAGQDQGPELESAELPPDLPSNPPPPPSNAPASGAPPPPGQSSADAAAGGGLTGLIVSALNQVFNYNSRSSQSPATGVGSAPGPAANGSVHASATDPASGSGNESSGGSGAQSNPPNPGPGGQSSRDNDEETPASRRQRLDSDFVDFDLE